MPRAIKQGCLARKRPIIVKKDDNDQLMSEMSSNQSSNSAANAARTQ